MPYAAGGATNRGNLSALCPRHHHLKHETGWQLLGDADDALIWRSPTGREYVSRPPTHPVDHTRNALIDGTDPPPF